jgi:hypothetical protein
MGVIASCAVALFVGLALLIRWSYVSTGDDVMGNGKGKGNCRLRDHTPIANDKGVVAILREADCPYDFSHGSFYYIVFVHKADEPNETQNIAVEYEAGYPHFGYTIAPPPKIVWSDKTSLSVVAEGFARRILTERASISGTRITYTLRNGYGLIE